MKSNVVGKPLCRVMMAVAIMLLSLQAMAYDFSYTYQGKTLYYKILAGSTNTVAVTYYSASDVANNHVSGDVVIPSSIEYNGTTYNVTSIGDSAFYYCSGLTSVTIPNGVTSIDSFAFFACSGLTSVTIGNSVTSIGYAAFYACSGLPSVTIPNSVTSIGEYALYSCSGLTSVTIGNSVTSIGQCAFYDCNSLTSVTIPNSVTIIDTATFSYCSNLTSITIGNSVTSIKEDAFYKCYRLASIKCLASIPPSISNDFSRDIPYTSTLTVPCGCLEAYTASDWREVFSRNIYDSILISEDLSFELSVSANDETYGSVAIGSSSCAVRTLTAIANEGYNFVIWNDGNTENPRTVSITSDTAFVAIFAEVVSTPTITLTVNDETMGSASYTLDGNTAVLTATANEGYNFVIWNDGNSENPRTVTITSDTAFMAIFSPAVSLQEVNAREFALYPNPAKRFVNLEFEALKENTLLQILDLNGRRVRTFDLKAGQEALRIEIGKLPEGVYTIMLGNAAKKLIVE